MAEERAAAGNFWDQARKLYCMPPDLEGLSEAQLKALHTFREQVLANAHDLYAVIPEARADPIMRNFFKTLVDGPPP